MLTRKEFEMTDAQLEKLMKACQPRAMIMLQCGTPVSPQDNANWAWQALGDELGFDYMSVKPVPGKLNRFFTAEPKEPAT